LDELREFDEEYIENTRSEILLEVAASLSCRQGEIVGVTAYKDNTNEAVGFTFTYNGEKYKYSYLEKQVRRI
jgi:hypothetical protein